MKRSSVRLQWDPDHDPTGAPVARRAIQLGLRRAALAGWDGSFIEAVHDISDFVATQRPLAVAPFDQLRVPVERVYPIEDPALERRLGLSDLPGRGRPTPLPKRIARARPAPP